MKKSEIIINGIRAKKFCLVTRYGRYILNNIMIMSKWKYLGDVPNSRPQFKFTDEQLSFDYEIGQTNGNLDTLIWRGYFSAGTMGIYRVYINQNESLVDIYSCNRSSKEIK